MQGRRVRKRRKIISGTSDLNLQKKPGETLFFNRKQELQSTTTNSFHSGTSAFIQPKLMVGKSNDSYEKQADAMALQVVSSPRPTVQKKCDDCQKEEKVQKKPAPPKVAANKASGTVESTLHKTRGGGGKMDGMTRDFMESRFEADFSQVNIHTGTEAIQMSNTLGAQAFTYGNDIYFNEGKYSPASKDGKQLLAHELTHTIQQKGRVQKKVQRKMGDGHDLKATRFQGDLKLEAAFDNETLIRFGAQGGHVTKLQQALIDSGHPLPKFGVDGIFGSETNGSVRSYQKSNGLLIDGIVGPQTMGNLDARFSGEPPSNKVPPVPPEICQGLELFTSPPKAKSGFVKSNFGGTETTGDAAPDENGPVECKTPPKEKHCSKLCGCPLPQNKTGPALNLHDVARPRPNSVFVGESCSDPNDVFRIIQIETEAKQKLTSASSSDNHWITVEICQGPNAGKTKVIQQRFLRQVQTLSLSITGPGSVQEGKIISLGVSGLPSFLTPHWGVSAPGTGEVNILSPLDGNTLDLEGKTPGKKNDVGISVAACGGLDTHAITVTKKPPGFVPPTGPCTPSPIDVKRIPGVMRSKSWNKGATIMENWFIGAPATAPSYGKIDDKTITQAWLVTFSKYTDKINKMLASKVHISSAAQSKIKANLIAAGLNTPGSTFSITLDPKSFNKKGLSVHTDSLQTAGPTDALTDMSAALGAFNIKVGVEGQVGFVPQVVPGKPGRVVVIIESVGFYVKDSFDFNGTQPLGFWNVCTNDVAKIPGGGRVLVMNKDFRDWRTANSLGQDVLIFSKDWDMRKLKTPDTFNW